jgi:hypothetical protein
MRKVWLACLLVAGAARADDGNPEVLHDAARIELGVGETVQRDVGFAMGLLCDDFAVIRAELRTATSESNLFEVTGVKPGDTVCRVGTAPSRPSYVFRIHVVTARH